MLTHAGAYTPLALDDLAVHDLQLLLLGVGLPLDVLGGRLDVSRRLSLREASITLKGSPTVSAGDRLLLTDAEAAPVAELLVNELLPAHAGTPTAQIARGPVTAVGEARWPDFGSLRTMPHHGRPPAGPASDRTAGGGTAAVALVGARPLNGADVSRIAALRAAGSSVLLLVPAVSATPDGVPYRLLVKQGIRLAAPLGVHVVAVPLAWRNPVDDEAVALATGAAYGADSTQLLRADDPDWLSVLSQLDDETVQVSATAVDPQTWHELRRWRPPPSKRGLVVMLTGLSGSGKSTLALALAEHVREHSERTVTLLDGDVTRRLLSSGLGFDRASREINVRRLGWVASEVARHGGMAVTAAIAPYAASRAEVRQMARQLGDFVLVHVATPLAECERRDRKGLYARARRGELSGMTGIDHPYEAPEDADLVLDTTEMSLEEALAVLVDHLRSHGWLGSDAGGERP